MYGKDILELCSSFLFLGVINLINDSQKNRKYHILSIVGLTFASLYYHMMEKLYYKYEMVTDYQYELSTYLDNFFILLLNGNLLFNPMISVLISFLLFKYNKCKYLYFVLTYSRTLYCLYKKNKRLECMLSFNVSILLIYCMYDYNKNGWYLFNSWLWHTSNLFYLVTSTYSEQKILNLKIDILSPVRRINLLN